MSYVAWSCNSVTNPLDSISRRAGFGANDRLAEAGRRLIAIKEALKHGQFGPWLKAHGIKSRTAQEHMGYATSGVSPSKLRKARKSAHSNDDPFTGDEPAPDPGPEPVQPDEPST
jgi:hypothetical protein